MEIWIDIDEFDGLFKVSNNGRVKSVKTGKILSQYHNSNGYWTVSVFFNKKTVPRLVHRLIAKAFIPNPENKPQINHINSIRDDNTLANMEWCTNSENTKHSYDFNNRVPPNKNKFRGEHSRAKLVIDMGTGIFYDSIIDAAIAKNINKSTLNAKLNGYKYNNTPIRYA